MSHIDLAGATTLGNLINEYCETDIPVYVAGCSGKCDRSIGAPPRTSIDRKRKRSSIVARDKKRRRIQTRTFDSTHCRSCVRDDEKVQPVGMQRRAVRNLPHRRGRGALCKIQHRAVVHDPVELLPEQSQSQTLTGNTNRSGNAHSRRSEDDVRRVTLSTRHLAFDCRIWIFW